MYITCPNCKQQIEDTEVKCPYCNAEINEEDRSKVNGRDISDYKDMPEQIKLMYEFGKRRKIKFYLIVSYVVSIFLLVPLVLIFFGYPAAIGSFVVFTIAFMIIASETKCYRCPFCDRMLPAHSLPGVHDDRRGMISGTYDMIKSADTSEPCPYCNGRTL